jgi:diguanylate cyclase (GGDEF)-like protein
MRGYRVEGVVAWSTALVIASVLLAAALSAGALHQAMRRSRTGANLAAALLLGAIVSLHVTAMAAFEVTPAVATGTPFDPGAMQSMAVVVAAIGMVIITTGLATVIIDRRTRSATFERLHQMAMYDGLTGLANRHSFNDHVDRQIQLSRQAGTRFAVIGIDLDRFKEINDQRGHQYGDEALRILARRMIGLAGSGEYVARLGGDEFGAVRPFSDLEDLVEFLARLKGAFYRPVEMDDYEITTGASLGVALFPQDGETREALVSNADLAMYRAKSDPLRAICFYDSSMDDVARRNRQLAADLRQAIERQGLELHYQVQRSVGGGQITGYEALVRWNHPTRGYIAPSEFIPLADETGLIHALGEWVLGRACADAMTWAAPYKVAVNLSAVQLAAATLPDLVHETLGRTGLQPHRLELEVTESSIMKDQERSLRAMQSIRSLGVGIALDDFGTGYSSLATLRLFPIDKIKLDRTFVADIETSQASIAIIRAVLALGKSLKIPVVAEGIERRNQLAILRTEGCDEAQGFLLGGPAPLKTAAATGTGSAAVLARPPSTPRSESTRPALAAIASAVAEIPVAPADPALADAG